MHFVTLVTLSRSDVVRNMEENHNVAVSHIGEILILLLVADAYILLVLVWVEVGKVL